MISIVTYPSPAKLFIKMVCKKAVLTAGLNPEVVIRIPWLEMLVN
jgi:hypothetical protein